MLSPRLRTSLPVLLTSLSVACVDATDPREDRPPVVEPAAPPSAAPTAPPTVPANPGLASCEGAELVRLDPTTWARAGSNARAYTMETDATLTSCNRVGVHMRSLPGATTDKFGTFMGTTPATPYRSKRIRLRAAMRAANVTGWASLWLRIDDADGKMLVLDNMKERALQGTIAPRGEGIVLDVPADAGSFAYGVMLSGEGETWASDIVLEVVGTDVPTTR